LMHSAVENETVANTEDDWQPQPYICALNDLAVLSWPMGP
jgi:hypothetical protein